MRRGLFITAALGLLTLWGCPSALAEGISYTLLKADTMSTHTADSCSYTTASGLVRKYVETGKYQHMWIDFCVVAPAAVADTALSLALAVREILPQYTISGAADTAAAWSDSTVIWWMPNFGVGNATTNPANTTDTLSVGNNIPANTTHGSNEIRVTLPVRQLTDPATGYRNRTARVDLWNSRTGAPYRAKWTSFRWRLLNASEGVVQNPPRVRVVLGGVTW